jgi:leucyl aminopeptidase
MTRPRLDSEVNMSGAAAVISAMDEIATLGSDHEIHSVAACGAHVTVAMRSCDGPALTAL